MVARSSAGAPYTLDTDALLCLACGHAAFVEETGRCGACGTEGAAEAPERAVPMREVRGRQLERVTSGDAGLDAALGGGWPLGRVVLVWGDPGSGKSRLCCRWAAQAGVWLLVSLEAPADEAVQLAASAGADTARGFALGSASGWVREARRVAARAVVIDSAHASDPMALVLDSVRAARDLGALVFLIAHRNARGQAKGDTGLGHWPDAIVRLRSVGRHSARVQIRKSRFCARGVVTLALVPGARAEVDAAPRARAAARRRASRGATETE